MTGRNREPGDATTEDRDLLDTFPRLGRATSQIERSFGPSCLLSLVIVLLLLVVLRRFITVGWLGTGILVLVIWYGVFALLIRWRPDRVLDDD